MKIRRLEIAGFRGIVNASLHFDGHTLLVGTNNVGKSTVFEAIDLVLGPDRLFKKPPIDEFDFYNAKYLEEDRTTTKSLRIEIVLTSLSKELTNKVAGHTEYWYNHETRMLGEGELSLVDNPQTEPCLRLETIGTYDIEDDDFIAETFYSHSPHETEGKLKGVSKTVKQTIGFLYLRTLRTGSRALTLERGSLLDIILRLGKIRTGLWEEAIARLKTLDPPIDQNAANLKPVLESIEKRIGQYIQLNNTGQATSLFVSNLTREHLRKTISFFLAISPDQAPVPFQEVGTGTLNTLVLALLSFIAEIKKENVIFAMEEPEIALPPHTQRRIADYLLTKTTQCFVTSHSPYIIEMFDPEQVHVLRRSDVGDLSSTKINLQGTIKAKSYKKHARRGLCETMLGKGVIIVEGLTEQIVLWALARKMEEDPAKCYPLDLSGVTIFCNDGDGLMVDFGLFYKSLGLKVYALLDKKKNRPKAFTDKQPTAFDVCVEHDHIGIEALLAAEIPANRLWPFLETLRDSGDHDNVGIPASRPADDTITSGLIVAALKHAKGDGTAGQLIETCQPSELPKTLVDFMLNVYKDFPAPAPTLIPPGLSATAEEAPTS